MFQVDNKFEIDSECYTCYRKPIHYKCPICEGAGRFTHNGYEIACRNCSGSGKLHNSDRAILNPCRVRVRTIKVSKNSLGEISIRYTVEPLDPWDINVKKRGESALFNNLEECEDYCRKVNQLEIPAQF